MPLKLYRCVNCRREFEAERPACVPCGLDPAKDPRDAAYVVECVRIHLDPPTHIQGRGKGHAACDPKLRVGRPGMQFSGEPRAVNCEACKATAEFKAAEAGELPIGPLPIAIKPDPDA